MKIVKIVSVIIYLLLNTIPALARESSHVRISGKIQDENNRPLNGKLLIYIQEGFHSVLGTQSIVPIVCAVEDGMYEAIIPVSNPKAYVSFSLFEYEHVRERDYGINFERFFLVEDNDDIHVDINHKEVSITGRGAARWRCQYEIYSLGGRDRSQSIKAANEQNYTKENEEIKRSNDAFIDKCVNILDRYRDELSSEIYQQLYYDCIGRANMLVLQPLKLSGYREKGYIEASRAFFYEYYTGKEVSDQVDLMRSLSSISYSNYLFERAYVEIMFGLDELPMSRFNFFKMYNFLKNRYRGPMADKLIYMAFLWWGGQEEVLNFWDEAMEEIESEEIRKRMVLFRATHTKGNMVYDFSLRDTLGNIYTPEHFRGKKVVVDFWFTGCIPCKHLAIALDTLMEDFQHRNDVVFLSVNVDKNESRWKSGLKSGEYTNTDQINLTTGGRHHPLLKEYQYDSFPKLMIFDKEGKIVSTNVPRPLDKESMNALKKLLD